MAISISVAEVVELVCDRTQIATPGPGEFVTDATMLRFVKNAGERLGSLLLEAYGASVLAETHVLYTQAGLDKVSLPPNFSTLRALHWTINGKAYHLEPAPVGVYDPAPITWDEHAPPRYRVHGNALLFTPAPSAVYTLRVDYTTTLAVASLSDSFPGEPNWKEWLVLDVCEQIRDRQEKDGSSFSAKKLKIEHDLREQADLRDRFARHQVQDTRDALSARGSSRQRFGRY